MILMLIRFLSEGQYAKVEKPFINRTEVETKAYVFKFTDPATGCERGKDFYDSCEAVLQADGSSRWVDEWHVDGGWEYANDFKNGNFICKRHPGGFDFVRRRKWVRQLLQRASKP